MTCATTRCVSSGIRSCGTTRFTSSIDSACGAVIVGASNVSSRKTHPLPPASDVDLLARAKE
jgi:hypothetical protein